MANHADVNTTAVGIRARHRRVVALTAAGLSAAQIALKLGVSSRTVMRYRSGCPVRGARRLGVAA